MKYGEKYESYPVDGGRFRCCLCQRFDHAPLVLQVARGTARRSQNYQYRWVEAVNELSEYQVKSYVLESIASSDMTLFDTSMYSKIRCIGGKFARKWRAVR